MERDAWMTLGGTDVKVCYTFELPEADVGFNGSLTIDNVFLAEKDIYDALNPALIEQWEEKLFEQEMEDATNPPHDDLD